MSWNGFVKAVNRATTSVMMSAGTIEKTVDKEYEKEEERFRNLEQRIERLHKEAKGYLDATRAMAISQKRIAETVDQFYPEGSKMGYAAVQYKDVVTKLDEESRTQLDETYRTTVLDPLGKYVAAFPEFDETIKKRERKLLDYDRCKASVKKQADKPTEDTSKLPKAEADAQAAKQVYDDINQKLLDEIPKLIELRIPYLEPCFESLVKNQSVFYKEAATRFEGVKKGFEYGGKTADGYGLEGQTDVILQQMKQLSICNPVPSTTMAQ